MCSPELTALGHGAIKYLSPGSGDIDYAAPPGLFLPTYLKPRAYALGYSYLAPTGAENQGDSFVELILFSYHLRPTLLKHFPTVRPD